MLAQEIFVPAEVLRITNDDAWDAKLHNGTCAHHAGRQRGIKYRIAICPLPPGLAQSVHFAVSNRIALLHALIASARDHFAITRQNRANWATALIKPCLGLIKGHTQQPHVSIVQHFQVPFRGRMI